MYRRIAVAVDGSATSQRALDEAIGLAREGGASLLLLHVSEELLLNWDGADALSPVMPAVPYELVEEMGQRVLDQARERVRQAGLDAEVQRLDEGGLRVGQVIVEAAAAWGADLLVIGAHGRKGLERWLLGSVAESVMRAATMPVLMVRGI